MFRIKEHSFVPKVTDQAVWNLSKNLRKEDLIEPELIATFRNGSEQSTIYSGLYHENSNDLGHVRSSSHSSVMIICFIRARLLIACRFR